MVLSLRDDPIQAAFEKFAIEFSASMAAWTEQFFTAKKQIDPKPELEHQRKIFVCGYTQEEDCLCVATETTWSVYDEQDDQHDVTLGFEDETQSQMQIHDHDAPLNLEVGDHECFQTKIETSSP